MITVDELDKVIVGEIEARQTIFLCACGMFVENSNIASYNLLVNDLAGAGKDYITTKTLSLFPKHLRIKRTRISPTVFTYWHNSKFEPKWTWNMKVLYLEDISSNVLNSSVFKVMCSSGSYATIVKDQRAIDIKIVGKPVLIITSASADPSPELTRRFTILNCDSGVNQTTEIVKRHLAYAEVGESVGIMPEIRDALSNLLRVKVKIPFARKLLKYIPVESIIMRTHILRLLDYIKASTALHQWQRKRQGDFIVADMQDYQIARIVLMKTSSNQYMIPLTKDQKRLLGIFDKEYIYKISELEPKVTWMSERWLRKQLNKLSEYGLLSKDSIYEDRRNYLTYKKNHIERIVLPEWFEG